MSRAVRAIAVSMIALVATIQLAHAQGPDRRSIDALRQRTWSDELIGRSQSFAPKSLTTAIQRHLDQLGLYHGPVDGRLSAELARAITEYQKTKNVSPNGWVTYDLLDLLEGREAARIVKPVDPVVVAAPEPPPPPPPPARDWSLKGITGKGVHGIAGDLMGRVQDVVVGTDGLVGGLVVGMANRYGVETGNTLIDWKMVGAAASRAAIMLPLGAEQAAALRRNPPPLSLAPNQRLASRLPGNPTDVAFDADGKMLHAVYHDADGARLVPARQVFDSPPDE